MTNCATTNVHRKMLPQTKKKSKFIIIWLMSCSTLCLHLVEPNYPKLQNRLSIWSHWANLKEKTATRSANGPTGRHHVHWLFYWSTVEQLVMTTAEPIDKASTYGAMFSAEPQDWVPLQGFDSRQIPKDLELFEPWKLDELMDLLGLFSCTISNINKKCSK